MTDANAVDIELRSLLRTTFDALSALEAFCQPGDGFGPQNITIDDSVDMLVDGFSEDVVGQCEQCRKVLLVGEKGHVCHEGEPIFCAEHAYTWGEVKDQWDGGEHGGDDDSHKCFVTAYEAHIANGGTPQDKMLRTL